MATKQQWLNGAKGRAAAVTTAAAESIRPVAEGVEAPGGYQAVQLLVAEQYVDEPGLLATQTNTMLVPANVGVVSPDHRHGHGRDHADRRLARRTS